MLNLVVLILVLDKRQYQHGPSCITVDAVDEVIRIDRVGAAVPYSHHDISGARARVASDCSRTVTWLLPLAPFAQQGRAARRGRQ